MRTTERRTALAAWMLVLYGVLVLVVALVEVRRRADLPTAPSWTVLHLVILLVLSMSLLRGYTWAWWAAVVLVVAELLLLLPLVIAVVGGTGAAELVPRLDLLLVMAEALVLAVVLALLIQVRRSPR